MTMSPGNAADHPPASSGDVTLASTSPQIDACIDDKDRRRRQEQVATRRHVECDMDDPYVSWTALLEPPATRAVGRASNDVVNRVR